jgi:hypothetical protein
LEVWHQFAVLAELEECGSGEKHEQRAFVLRLVNDLAEAYFDAVGLVVRGVRL